MTDLRYLAESQPSLCIPRVFNNITESRVRQVFDELGLGRISAIDIKERKNEKGDSFKRIYVHFENWFWNENAQTARQKLISGKEIKIVYDNPWFWKVSASKWTPSRDYEIGNTNRSGRFQIIDEERGSDTRPKESEIRNTEKRDTRPRDTRPRDTRPKESEIRNTKKHDTRPRDTRPRDTRPKENCLKDTRVKYPTIKLKKKSLDVVVKDLDKDLDKDLKPLKKEKKKLVEFEIEEGELIELVEIEEFEEPKKMEELEKLEELEELEELKELEEFEKLEELEELEEISEERKELLNDLYGDI